jgi:hypothetical protein
MIFHRSNVLRQFLLHSRHGYFSVITFTGKENVDGSESVLEFRIEPRQRWHAFFVLVMASAFAVMGFTIAHIRNRPDSIKVGLAMGGIAAGFVFLSLYMLDSYRTYRLYLGNKMIRQIGVFTKQSISIPVITEIRWGNRHGGGPIRITTPEGTLSIAMFDFSQNDRIAIMQFLRTNVAERLQTNFKRFRYSYLLDPAQVAEREVKSTKALKKYYKTYFFIFLFHVIAFGAMGFGGRGPEFFYYAGLNAVACIWLRWQEKKLKRQDSTNE